MKKLMIMMMVAGVFNIANANENLINVKSNHSVDETVKKFEKIVLSKGMKVFAIIDHAKGAKSIGKKLRDTTLVIFGSPKAGTPLLKSNQQIGLDLPLKVLIWQNEKSEVFITYKKPKHIVSSHNIMDKNKVVKKMTNALGMFSRKSAH